MKKLLSSLLVLTMTLSFSAITFAETTDAPILDDYPEVIDGTRYIISGTTTADAIVHIADGPSTVSSVQASANGEFEIELPLRQNTINIYQVYAQVEGETASNWVSVTIQENASAARTAEFNTGEDRTSPSIPVLIDWEISETELTATLSGSGESGTEILVNGEPSGVSVSNLSTFELTLDLTGNGVNDVFQIAVRDDAGLLSPIVELTLSSDLVPAEPTDPVDSTNEATEPTEPATETIRFSDIENHWSREYVEEINNLGAASGYSDGSFGVERNITRAELLAMAYRAMHGSEDGIEYNAEDLVFEDVDSSMWFQSLFHWANSNGIVAGYTTETGTEARPNANITRAAALKIILLSADLVVPTTYDDNFSDVTEDNWFASIAAFAKENGFVSGENDEFLGNREITRAEAAKIIVLVREYAPTNSQNVVEGSETETPSTTTQSSSSGTPVDDERATMDPSIPTI